MLKTPVQTGFSAWLPVRRACGGKLLIASDRSYGLFIWWLYFVPPTNPETLLLLTPWPAIIYRPVYVIILVTMLHLLTNTA